MAKQITTGSTQAKYFINSTMDAIDSCSPSDMMEIDVVKHAPIPSVKLDIKVVKQAPISSVTPESEVIEKVPIQVVKSIDRIFGKFKFPKESGLLQFWSCKHSNSEDSGHIVTLTDQFFMSPPNEGLLQDYRNNCRVTSYPVVGQDTDLGNWSAGRAAQTRIADHWTIHHVTIKEDQHSINVGRMGLLALPVFNHQDVLVGIIEFVTVVPKESYAQDFERIHNLLRNEGLKSGYMGKKIKFGYKNELVVFTLNLSAKFTDLQKKVGKRFPELEQHKNFYADDTKGNHLPISNDRELKDCMDDSSSKGAKFIRMCVLLNR